MLGQCLLHLLVVHVFPCCGNVLLAGVGPPVAVVEVNHDGHVLQFGAQGHLQHVLFAAQTVCGIHPNAVSGGIQAVGFHQLGVLAGLSLDVVERHVVLFQGGGSTDVGTQPERVVFLCCHCKAAADGQRSECRSHHGGSSSFHILL